MTDRIQLVITQAAEVGFTISEGGEVVAALTSRHEVAQWIEDRLGNLPGVAEREAQDMADATEAFPNVISRTDPKGRFGRRK